jgi:hypothetical protein
MKSLPKNLKLKQNDLVEIHAYQSFFWVKIKEILKDRISGSFIIVYVFKDGKKVKNYGNLKDSGDFVFKDINSFKKVIKGKNAK